MLWHVKINGYLNKHNRSANDQILLGELKEIKADAAEDVVKKYRASFHAENVTAKQFIVQQTLNSNQN